MQLVCLALAPAGVAGVVLFGLPALGIILLSVVSCVAFEYLFQRLNHQKVTIGDWSAVVTGLLLAYNIPASAPWWVPVFGGFLAIVLVKQLFGGIGANFMNPALTARAILFVSFSGIMASYPQTKFAMDAVSSATPLAMMAENGAASVSLMSLLVGNCGGVLGETCKLAVIAGGIFLIVTRVIDWKIPVCFIATAFVCYLLRGGVDLAVKEIMAGGLMLGAFFMATDYATSPVSNLGRVIMGVGCGLLLFIIREFASYPEGCSFAILFMNVCTPLIDRFTMPVRFGEVKKHA